MAEIDETWTLVCPAENYKKAELIGELTKAELIELMVAGCGLVKNANAEQKKLYIKAPEKVPAAQAKVDPKTGKDGLTYPSGVHLERHPQNNSPDYAPARSGAPPLIKVSPDVKVSENFKLSEFICHDRSYTGARVHPDLVSLLEKIRSQARAPVKITSGYRPPAYNRSVGGVSDSFHLDGFAADIWVPGMSTNALRQICEAVVGSSGGVGYYPTQGFVHVDVRGYPARWNG